MMKKFQMVERPLRRPKWRVASRQWDLAGMTMTLLDRRRRLGQPRRNAHRPAGERISQGGRRGTWVLCRGPSGTAALGMCAAFAGPGGRRGARDTGSRETWGLSRLWCIPAVVAYVVCMYRVRARLFATGRPHHATAPCDGMTDRQHDSERDGIHTRHGDTAGSLTLFRILTLTLDDLYLRYSRTLFSCVGIS